MKATGGLVAVDASHQHYPIRRGMAAIQIDSPNPWPRGADDEGRGGWFIGIFSVRNAGLVLKGPDRVFRYAVPINLILA